jgi:hypothetical protein
MGEAYTAASPDAHFGPPEASPKRYWTVTSFSNGLHVAPEQTAPFK